MMTNSQILFKFFGDNPPGIGNTSSVEHITPDGGRSVLCGKKTRGKAWDDANWEALHSPRFHRQCPLCRSRAILAMRPTARFWYLDPFHGNLKEFPTLKRARQSARTEHGSCTLWQTGPGEVNRIIETVRGMDPIP